jgi:hypothetical protein
MFFSDDPEARGPEDPLKRFVCAMCLYAGEIFQGTIDGPYRDADARAYARWMLIPGELLEFPGPAWRLDLDSPAVDVAAAELGVPTEELRLELGQAQRAHEHAITARACSRAR